MAGLKTALENYGYKPPNDNEQERKITTAFLDFTLYLQEPQLLAYVWRRWDVYNTLSATKYAMFLGLAFSISLRMLIEHFHCGVAFWTSQALGLDLNSSNLEMAILVFFTLCILVLTIFFSIAQETLLDQYYPMLEALVVQSLQVHENWKKLKEAFPNHFSVLFCSKCSEEVSKGFVFVLIVVKNSDVRMSRFVVQVSQRVPCIEDRICCSASLKPNSV